VGLGNRVLILDWSISIYVLAELELGPLAFSGAAGSAQMALSSTKHDSSCSNDCGARMTDYSEQ
jgi:hypothetical protein